jgi:hypothetical protein
MPERGEGPELELLFFNTESARKGHVNRWWVAQAAIFQDIVEYGLWATSTILGLLADAQTCL